MFRLGDAYLIYAEAHLRGGGGDPVQALAYLNALRGGRTGIPAPMSGRLTHAGLRPERAGARAPVGGPPPDRPDPVRSVHGPDYVWAWKGGAPLGTSTEGFRDLYPLPASELTANPNLVQNPGY